jgi:deazaflavin-dependent oxidoreductase (nitroreductase family)
MALAQSTPRGFLRLLLHLPDWLYRLHLGWLLGHRFLMLTHRGRKSGNVYHTVVEVVRYDPATRESVVLAAWRGETDWHRNIQARPALAVTTGCSHYVPAQRLLSPEETAAELRGYVARHPWVANQVLARLFALRIDGSAASYREAAFFRGVAFRPIGRAD